MTQNSWLSICMGFFDTYTKLKQTADLGNTRAAVEDMRYQNGLMLQQAELQNAQLMALRNQISVANEVNRQILENQFREAERIECQRFYKDYLFLINRLLPEIWALPTGPIRYEIFNKLQPIMEANAELAMEALDEISDKATAQNTVTEITKMSANLVKDHTAHSKSILKGFREIEAEYLEFKNVMAPQAPKKQSVELDASEQEALRHALKKNMTPKKLVWIGIVVLILGLVVLPISGFLALVGSLGCIGGGLFIIFSTAAKLRRALNKRATNQGNEIVFQKELATYTSAVVVWQQALAKHEYNGKVASIRAQFPEYFSHLKRIEELTQAFAGRWNLGKETGHD